MGLAKCGGLDRIHSGLQISLFEKVAPTDVPVFGGLALFELLRMASALSGV